MSHKPKSDLPTCEKFLNRMLRQEVGNRKAQPKFHQVGAKPAPKPKPNIIKTQSPVQRITAQVYNSMQEQEVKNRNRSRSRGKSNRDTWGEVLKKKSREKVSSFSNFDPLRTLHFLSKELFSKLENTNFDDEILQMVSDIQHALKRIPGEVTTLLSGRPLDNSGRTGSSQTPPTMYQEDAEKFEKIMAENNRLLEASCKELEVVCASLQQEKAIMEKELEEAKEHIEFLCKRVKDLQEEQGEDSQLVAKTKQLEEEKRTLQFELTKTRQEVDLTLTRLEKQVEELKSQKRASDEACSKLEYDCTLLKLEKEKYATMLSIRDKEIKDIQAEMAKIQEQVDTQFKKLNKEVLRSVDSLKASENAFLEIGDTTLSSITTNEGDRESINIIKESPCGDAEIADLQKKEEVEKNKEVFEELLTGLTPSLKSLLSQDL